MAYIKLRNNVADDKKFPVHNVNGKRVELKKGDVVEVKEMDAKSYLNGYADVVMRTNEEPNVEETEEKEEVNWDDLNKKELKQKLDNLGVEYDKDLLKDELVELVEANVSE